MPSLGIKYRVLMFMTVVLVYVTKNTAGKQIECCKLFLVTTNTPII